MKKVEQAMSECSLRSSFCWRSVQSTKSQFSTTLKKKWPKVKVSSSLLEFPTAVLDAQKHRRTARATPRSTRIICWTFTNLSKNCSRSDNHPFQRWIRCCHRLTLTSLKSSLNLKSLRHSKCGMYSPALWRLWATNSLKSSNKSRRNTQS